MVSKIKKGKFQKTNIFAAAKNDISRRKEINAAIVGLKIIQNAEQSGVFCMIFRADLKR